MQFKTKLLSISAILLGVWFINPSQALATVDLGVRVSDISFSTNSFVSGQKATVYVKVRSVGDEDASGMVNLYLNNELLAAGLAVSVVSSEPDTVYSEFTVPDKNFKISVDLKNVFPSDSQLGNNNAITSEQTVDIDTDRDGIGDMKDNDDDNDGLSDSEEARLGTNPKKVDTDGDGYGDANDAFPLDRNEWLDTDHDGIGDNADTDDDNDGLSDSQEANLKTNPKRADTDGDGYNDKEDAYPLDPTRHAVAVVVTPPATTKPSAPATPKDNPPTPVPSQPSAQPSAPTTATVDTSGTTANPDAAQTADDRLQGIQNDLDKIKNGESLDTSVSSIFHADKPGFWVLLVGLFAVMVILLKVRYNAGRRPRKAKALGPDEFEKPASAQLERQIEASFRENEPEPVRIAPPKPQSKSVTVRVKKIQPKR